MIRVCGGSRVAFKSRTWSSNFGFSCSGTAGKEKNMLSFIRCASRRKAEIGEINFRRIVVGPTD